MTVKGAITAVSDVLGRQVLICIGVPFETWDQMKAQADIVGRSVRVVIERQRPTQKPHHKEKGASYDEAR